MKQTIWVLLLTAALLSLAVGCSKAGSIDKQGASDSVTPVTPNAVIKQIPATPDAVIDLTTATPNAVIEQTPATAAEESAITIKDKDGLILFSLSMKDAFTQVTREATSDEIKVTKDAEKTNYSFYGLVLSCGTHMLGNITEQKVGESKAYKGSFKVSTNPYEITSLEIDALQDEAGMYSGILKVDGKELDIALL